MFSKLLTIIVVFYYYSTVMTKAFTIREVSMEDDVEATTTSSVTETSYRKSVAKIKETPYRVPEHLQFVPKGFVYEDAADVIHVIDPPKHFEELKKIMQQQQQRQYQNLRPTALREQRPKLKIVKTVLKAKHRGEPVIQRKPLAQLDMQTQESQHLPLEILASVRKTENFLRKYKPQLPAVKERLKTQKIQTVIWEKQQEQQQYQQGQEQRLQGIREQTDNRRRFNKNRFKRHTKPLETQPLQGEALLTHINELIKNASSYLKQTENYEDYPDDTEFETTTLQGEILLKTTKAPASNVALNDDMVVKILENSVKATNVIMKQIRAQTNRTSITQKCDYLKVTYPNHIQNLQNQIKCMQNFIKDINHTQQQQQEELESLQKPAGNYDDDFEPRKSKDFKHKPFIVAQLTEDYIDDAATATPLNSSLIYDDVMTTIRNMLQSQNLQSIEDPAGRITSPWEEPTVIHDVSTEPLDFNDLHEYLTSLETIVTNLPKFNHKSLNLQEIEGGSTSKYYFINPQGSIYSLPQPFHKDTTTAAPTTIFHYFPDLPYVQEHLKNGTLLPPSSKVLEIL